MDNKEFKQAVSSLQKKNVKSLIIDLRDNPGGLLDVCVDIADYLLGEGTIVYTKDNNGDTQYYKSDEKKVDLPMPCGPFSINTVSNLIPGS